MYKRQDLNAQFVGKNILKEKVGEPKSLKSRKCKMKPKILLVVVLITLLTLGATTLKPEIEFLDEVKIERRNGEKWIGIISDTHFPTRAKEIPEKVFRVFKGVDLIVHAGDLVVLDVIKELEKIAPVVAVQGNMDWVEVKEKLPEITSFEVQGKRIGVTHDAGIFGMEKMEKIAKENGFDILIFGHTHRQFLREKNGILYVNPGSPTNPIPPFMIKPSVALMKISKEKVEVYFVKV